jgi:4-amino-4-deoxy-L-arabinose transferase-like glycosyltransferase
MKPSRAWYTNPWLHAAVILLVASAFRLWQIDSIPPGLFGDEATDGLDALDVLAGRGAVFFPANFGREGLHMWIIAGMFRLLGVVPLALRLPSAIVGILTALATYWLGRELLAAWSRSTADRGESPPAWPWSFLPLVAALYIATSYWHVHFSRFGIRGVFTPFLGGLAFAAFWRAVNRRSYVWFAVSGACLGLATHFYTASRFFPFFLGGFLLLQGVVVLLSRRREQAILAQHLSGIVLLFAVAALVFAPLGIYFLQHPGTFTQRAGVVTALGEESPLLLMGRAAMANVLQFLAPGRGDVDQFYNLPGRAVFDPLTAVLALLGLGLVAWRWRHASALFLLLWFPALLLPSFLATDRWPTLPRVLGIIPGVYFFPAIGLIGAVTFLLSLGRRGGVQIEHAAKIVAVILLILAPSIHAARTYRDYFQTWGPSAQTFDAFEGDMTAAWRWLTDHPAAGHIYLSSDIYRHPTFMLLHERASVQTFWQHANPELSWFDARQVLPLPAPGEQATYLIAASSPLNDEGSTLLRQYGQEIDQVFAPGGSPALTVIRVSDTPDIALPSENAGPPIRFTENLALTGAAVVSTAAGAYDLRLSWHTLGPDPAAWPAYRLEIKTGSGESEAAAGWQGVVPFDAFRPPEWTAGGRFLSWHRLEGLTGTPPTSLSLRLIDQQNDTPVAGPGISDGWHVVQLTQAP